MLEGRALATLSARSAAARRRMAVAGPPGGLGEAGRAVVLPVAMGDTGESADWSIFVSGCVLAGWVVWYGIGWMEVEGDGGGLSLCASWTGVPL